jgi:hypothetical protein
VDTTWFHKDVSSFPKQRTSLRTSSPQKAHQDVQSFVELLDKSYSTVAKLDQSKKPTSLTLSLPNRDSRNHDHSYVQSYIPDSSMC